ncbi:MAG: cytochrome c-type biogenesis protein CcmH [Candidatus Azotimanducaceae bacterium]|jgi:cytochrome c-type biogenesis protein CcmH
MKQLTCLVFALILPMLAHGAIDAYEFPNDEMRSRYNSLIDELRCPQCLNTNLAGSDAMVAKDLRREVHRLVLEGKTDSEVREYMLARYGDFILYDPQLKKETILLWFGPLVLFLIALIAIYRVTRKRRQNTLSPEEQARLNQLIDSVDL